MTEFNIDKQEALELLNQPAPNVIKDIFNAPYPLSENQILSYHKDGYVKLSAVLSAEAIQYTQSLVEAAVFIRKAHDQRALADKSQYEQSFLQCGYLCWDFPAVKEMVFGKRFARLARDLMRVEHARLWHDQALFKEAGGRLTDTHQDSSYWPISNPLNSGTLWLALSDVPPEKGCLHFYPQSHKNSPREYVDIFKKPHQPQALNVSESTPVPLKAGDATFHSGLTFHGAGPNITEEMRQAMTIIYIDSQMHFDASDKRNAIHTSCDGLQHGQIIDTNYTPILS